MKIVLGKNVKVHVDHASANRYGTMKEAINKTLKIAKTFDHELNELSE